MTANTRSNNELGQTAVLFALMIVGVVAAVGLAVDGGHILNSRRVTQNAADASALGGVRYMATSDSPDEQVLLSRIHEVIEANGLPDTDGTPSNEINGNVVAYYTDERGNRMVSPNCIVVGSCSGSVPPYALGLEVQVTNPVDTYFMGIIGQRTISIGADAVAVTRGSTASGLAENVMIALGSCTTADRQLTGRGNDNEFLGGLYSNSWFDSTGNSNHYHGQVTSFEPYYRPAGDATVYEPNDPVQGEIVSNPFAGWSYIDFAPGSAIANANAGFYFDVSVLDHPTKGQPGIVEMSEIKNQTLYPDLYDASTKRLRTGIYYAGTKQINIGEPAHGQQEGVNGVVTIVSGNRIKMTEGRMNLSAYMAQDSAFPGLLFFSDFALPGDPCAFQTNIDAVINMAGNNGKSSEVYHPPDDIPNKADPLDYEGCPYPRIDGCYVASNNIFTGLIYAPNGRVDTSDSRTTYIGAIVAFTIDYSGNENLFVTNSGLFPRSDPSIFLER